MNKFILKYELDFDFVLIAVSCPLKDYRLCHFINKQTGLDFRNADDYRAAFSRYAYAPEAFGTEYFLIANRSEESGYLIPEMKTSDYFLLIRNFIDEEDLEHLLDQINAIPEVVVATEIAPEKLKSRENLIF